MSLLVDNRELPLFEDSEHEVIRVGETRVSLDSVVHAFNEGATPEEIVQQFSVLNLADVYDVIGYYLKNKEKIENYLEKREDQAEKIRIRNEDEFNLSGLREKLISRTNG
jgi:uncharacterized protein (DUF433 family)